MHSFLSKADLVAHNNTLVVDLKGFQDLKIINILWLVHMLSKYKELSQIWAYEPSQKYH